MTKKKFKKDDIFLSIGMLSLVAAITINRFGPNTSLVHFSEGLFMGLSLVMNLAFLVRYTSNKWKEQEQ